ncbi:hypothetical protein CK501_14545 [Halovibrio salipaludis]|uniref:Uncharacterized protein n=1 Tax=Halovibrio salipaludis TaxID=2032626 RepID=A0A2A2EZ91_9GAMM|nr:hypothetical protein [Halovibrio salipaludis]PAU77677.1 hypothetical protein CK501_14545 [Halovibrio salipaludis]
MRYRQLLVFVVCLGVLLFASSVWAEAVDEKVEQKSRIEQLKQQNMLLQERIDVVREHQGRVLSTVQWALSILAIVAVLLLGYNWFSNKKIYERDKAAMNEEMERHKEQVDQRVKTHFEGEANRLNKEVSEVEQRLNGAVKQKVDETIADSIKKLEAKISRVEQNSNLRLVDVEFTLEWTDHERWVEKDVMANALTSATRMLEISFKANHDWYLDQALDVLEKDIDTLAEQKRNQPPESTDVSNLSVQLEKVPAEKRIVVDSIKEKLSRLRAGQKGS